MAFDDVIMFSGVNLKDGYMTSITTSAYKTSEISQFYLTPGRITWVGKNFYTRVKSKISLSGVQEYSFKVR